MSSWNEQKESLSIAICASESPIEALMLTALFAHGKGDLWTFGPQNMGRRWEIVPQHHVGDYRVDIAVVNAPKLLAIELDGRLWHERSEAQVQAGNRRQRDLAAAGWTLLRFTGGEVWKDPCRCAQSAVDCLEMLAAARAAETTPVHRAAPAAPAGESSEEEWARELEMLRQADAKAKAARGLTSPAPAPDLPRGPWSVVTDALVEASQSSTQIPRRRRA